MNQPLTDPESASIVALVRQLETAWNAGDGAAFAAPFAVDADFVTIRAEHLQGRPAIARGHAEILRTIYAGSRNRFTLESLRWLRSDVALAHVRAELDAPAGPLAGRHAARFSAVLVRNGTAWEIAAFHNTLAPGQPPAGGAGRP